MTNTANAYVAGIRLANLHTLIEVFGSRNKFCEVSGASYSHLSQILMKPKEDAPRSGRGLGPNFCRKLEKALSLPEHCLDRENGVAPYINVLVITHALPAPTLSFDSESPPDTKTPSPMPGFDLEGLSALEVAAVDALIEAMQAKKFGKQDCMALLAKCIDLTEA